MKKYFEFGSKKFFILLFLVCFLFVIVVINAFMYLPQNQKQENISIERTNSINKPEYTKKTKQAEENNDDSKQQKTSEKKTMRISKVNDDIDIVEIDAPKGVNPANNSEKEINSNISDEESASDILQKAQEYRASKQYIKALDEFQKLSDFSSDKKIIALSYDGIASLYAINKRYGTALSYAIKAYNTYPTSEREMMLARLYYKTGNLDKATERVNNILRREFTDDRW